MLDGMAVGVIRRQVCRLLVFADALDDDRSDRSGSRLTVKTLPEAVAHTVLSRCVVGAGNASHIEDLLPLCQLIESDGNRARGGARNQNGLVFRNEAGLFLNGGVGLGLGVGDTILDLLAQHPLAGLWRNLLDQVVSTVDVLDGELVAFEFVLALHGVGACARHRDADEERGSRRSGRVGSDWSMLGSQGFGHEPGPTPAQPSAHGREGRSLQYFAPGKRWAERVVQGHIILLKTIKLFVHAGCRRRRVRALIALINLDQSARPRGLACSAAAVAPTLSSIIRPS